MPQRRIRVLQLVNGLGLGGAEKIVTTLAMNTNQERFEVIPCALHRSGPLEEDLRTAEINYRVIGLGRRSILTGPLFVADFWRKLVILTKILEELSIDIIHAHLTESILMGIVAARRKRPYPICATIHSIILHNKRGRFSPRGWLMRNAIDRVFSKANRIITVSQDVARVVRHSTRIPWDRIVTIPNGIDGTRFQFMGDRNALRQALGVPNEKPVAVTVGRLTRAKGYPHLLAALAMIPEKVRPLTLFVGDGPDRHELESRTRDYGLTNYVRFLGNRSDVPALLAAADLFVLSSLWEGLPLALLEAMASGLPSVVTKVGGNREAVEDGKSGLLVPPADEQALATALSSLVGNLTLQSNMRKAALDRFNQYFSLQSFVKAHEQLYEELLNSTHCRSEAGDVCLPC